METTKQQIDYRELFIRFLNEAKDDKGKAKYQERLNEMIAYRRKSIIIDFSDILSFNQELADTILNNTREILPLLESALYDYLLQLDPMFQRDVDRVHVRIINIPGVLELRKIRSSHINKLVCIDGILVKSTPVKEKVYKATLQHIHPDCMQEFEWPE
ncbi:MAG: Minichromosome maintenance protein MCM, partial [Saccharolobus sp.]